MKDETYRAALSLCQRCIDERREVKESEAEALGAMHESLVSLRRSIYTKYIRKVAHEAFAKRHSYRYRWKNGESLWDIGHKEMYSPYLIGRMIAEDMYPDKPVKEYMNNPDLIEDPRFAEELKYCIANDIDYSTNVDRIKQTIGLEYEFILQMELTRRNIPFETEATMRKRGMAKTPDIWLLVPIAVRDEEGSKWHIVTWIDSKAMFGEQESFEDQQGQLLGYVNRYGPGMVIYWFDFVEKLNSPSYSHYSSDIYASNCFPSDSDIMLLEEWKEDERPAGDVVIGDGADHQPGGTRAEHSML